MEYFHLEKGNEQYVLIDGGGQPHLRKKVFWSKLRRLGLAILFVEAVLVVTVNSVDLIGGGGVVGCGGGVWGSASDCQL